MKMQTKRLNETLTVRSERSITIRNRNLSSQWNGSQNRRIGAVNDQAEHQGYRLTARAEPAKSALHAAHLVIEGPGCPTPRYFHALDYFYEPGQALRYAIRWGRLWVDHRLTNLAAEHVVSTRPASCTELRLEKERTPHRACDHE